MLTLLWYQWKKESFFPLVHIPDYFFNWFAVFLGPTEQPTDRNTIVFRLQVECSRKKKAPKDATDPALLYDNHEVLSSQFSWQAKGEQSAVFANNPPAPINPNIVLAKLRPGQEVNMELHAIKGVGKDHAKFSPVGRFSCKCNDDVLWFSTRILWNLVINQLLRPIASFLSSSSTHKSRSPHISPKNSRNAFLPVSSVSIRRQKQSALMRRICGEIQSAEKFWDTQSLMVVSNSSVSGIFSCVSDVPAV